MTKKQILLNAFNMNCVGHINHGLWTHPRDTSTAYKTLDYWTHLARLLERGLFDGLFLADIVGVYDVYQDSADLTLRESIQLPVNDPLLIVPAMAAVTRHLGFGVTVNLTYETPYLLARRFSTLDHLTQGRVGWNIVTGYLERGARHGAVRADRARRALRPRRRIPGRGLSAVGRQLGRGRGQGRQARAGLCRSRRRAPGGP